MVKKELVIISTLLLVSGFCLGVRCEQATYKPKTIIKEVPIEVVRIVEVEKIVEVPVEVPIEVPIEVPVEVEVIREVPMELRDFASVDELIEWLVKDKTDEMLILTFNNGGVCEDYALRLQENGIEAGYKISFQVLYDKQFYQHYGKHLKRGTYHAVNAVIIGNELWYIEPQSDEIWLAAYLD